MRYLIAIVVVVLSLGLGACDRSADKAGSGSKPPAAAPAKLTDDHRPGEAHAIAGAKDDPGPKAQTDLGGEVIELGTAKIGEFTARASRDKVEFKPGGDAPIDVWIDGGVGKGVTAVRFWIGTQDAKGSIKAKAGIEDGKWHTHVEIPLPMPEGSKLWVEIEEPSAKKVLGSFDLRA
ncbi:MAG: hypothetical protein AABZ12_06145 [Planctomycetota bacterium]